MAVHKINDFSRKRVFGMDSGENTETSLPEDSQQGKAIKFTCHNRSDVLGLEPLIKAGPDRGAVSREQDRRPVERSWKAVNPSFSVDRAHEAFYWDLDLSHS